MRTSLGLALTVLLGGGMAVLAQTAQPQTTSSSPLPQFDDSLVVSASLDPEERDRIPASVVVVDAAELEARQVSNVAEAISLVSGLAVVQAGAPGQQTSLFIRGAESDQSLLLWNGLPLNDPYFGGANWQFVPTDGALRIEVVRGPFSSLYGSAAMGGVIQLLTDSKPGLSLRLEGGENSHGRGSAVGGGELLGAWIDAVVSSRRGGGALDNDEFDADDATLRATWQPLDGLSAGLVARGNRSQTGIPLSGGAATPERRIAWREREVALPLAFTRGPWELETRLSSVRFSSDFRDPNDPFGFTASDTDSEGRRGRVVGSWQHEGSQRDLRVSVGADVERLEVTDSSTFGRNLSGAHQRTWAGFGELSAAFGSAEHPGRVEVGVRRDDNDVYGGATSLRAGLVQSFGAGWRARASYGEAFRAPTLGELFFPFSGNPNLRPEEGRSAEIGLEKSVGNWRFDLTAFENRQRDLIDFDLVTFTNINISRARSRGAEFGISYRRGIGSVRLDGAYLEAENLDTGLRLLRRPEQSVNLFATLAPREWSFALTGRYVGERPDVDPITFERSENPSSLRVDLAARYNGFSRIQPFARVENVADREYAEALGFPASGRTFFGGFSIAWR